MAQSSAVWTNPSRIILGILNRYVIEVLEAKAAELFLAVILNSCFEHLSLLFIFNYLPDHQVVYKACLSRIKIGNGHSLNSLMDWIQCSMPAAIVLALCHYISCLHLFAVMTESAF